MPSDHDWAALYLQVGRLIEAIPDLTSIPRSREAHEWLGQAFALVEAGGDLSDRAAFRTNESFLGPTPHGRVAADAIVQVLYRTLARAELKAPAAVSGSFIPAGNAFDARVAVGKVLSGASKDVLIVEPYADEKVLTDFAPLAAEQVPLRLLSDNKTRRDSIFPAAQRWQQQHGASRPLELRLAPPRSLHDRLIVTDGAEAWVLTQSLNAFAARSPASIVRVDPETAALKIAAYEAVWAAAQPVP